MNTELEKSELLKLGENIRRSRRNLHITQEALAEQCGLHRTYLCDVERGARNVSFISISKLAKGLRTSISELMLNVETEAPSEFQESISNLCLDQQKGVNDCALGSR
jgi:transcriptional regulator with XRE-family HTH domain